MSRQSPRVLAARQRERREAARLDNVFENAVRSFESEMRIVNLAICRVCRRRTESTNISGDTCLKCIRARVNALTVENGLDFGLIPPQLSNLTLVEQVLIARVHPVVSVFRIRGQQLGYSGHVVNFVQHIEQIATRLPQDPSSLRAILLLQRDTPSGVIHFKVRARRVRDALVWLRRNNPHYRDIEIDESVLNELPEDGDIHEHLQSLNLEAEEQEERNPDNQIDPSFFPNLPAINVERAIRNNLQADDYRDEANDGEERDFGEWPQVSQHAANEFRNEGIICKAFPVLFPYGRGDFNEPRLHKLTPHEYFKFLIQYHDGRFACDLRFPYYAYNTLARWDALSQGNVFVRHRSLANSNVSELQRLINDPRSNLAESIMFYSGGLRGTRVYWRQRCSELTQMIKQVGMPHIFFTLSAADYHWPDLFRLLTDLDPQHVGEAQRRQLMHDNPAIVAWFFQKRCDIFMKKFLTRMFPVKDYWFRFEWQHRGSPHIHGLLWMQGGPEYTDIDSLSTAQRQELVDYFDQLVSASIEGDIGPVPYADNPCRKRYTDLDDSSTDLNRLLAAFQMHTRCGSHCLRLDRATRRMKCRFGFPFPLQNESELRIDAGCWKFFPKRNNSLLQRFNRFVSQAWRGNTDFTAIVSKEAVIHYIAKYASKGEVASVAYSDMLRDIVNESADGVPAATAVRRLLISSIAERNYSCQEVMHLLHGWAMYQCSRCFVSLMLDNEWRRVGSATNWLDRYRLRPARFMEYTLFDFTKKYKFSAGRFNRVQKEQVVRVFPIIKLSEDGSNEDYYRQQCMLHIPWLLNFEAIKDDAMTWEELYFERAIVEEFDLGDPERVELPNPDEIQFEEPERELFLIRRDPGMVAANYAPDRRERDLIGERAVDFGYDWMDLTRANVSLEQVNTFLRHVRQTAPMRQDRGSVISLEQMSPAQRSVIDLVYEQVDNLNHPIRRVIVQGKAGTGKSAIIKAMCRFLDDRLPNSYQVLAPTGAAAVNVDGKTVHNYLRLPVEGPLRPLDGDNLRQFQLGFRDVKFIIIDEYSMVGLRLLKKIHLRLCSASGSSAQPFGGFYVYMFGDLRQLPPVKDTAIYMEPRDAFGREALALVGSFQRKICLTVCHCLNRDQTVFQQILDSLATGTITEEGWRTLMRRRKALIPHEQVSFLNALELLPTNQQVKEKNESKLQANGRAVAAIFASHNNCIAGNGSDVVAQGLPARLYLSIGCRVILRKNLFVSHGLVNGSLGTVTDIIYSNGERPPLLPAVILIRFDKYAGPFFREQSQSFPILPITVSWREQGADCTRRQYPLNLAYAVTIHKAQGLTLDKAIVDIGSRETAPGLSYVALSRVKRFEDLALADGCNYNRLSSIGRMNSVVARERFLENFDVAGL